MNRLAARVSLLAFVLAALGSLASAQIQVFSTGQFGTPETISLAPSTFGTFGGNYFIPDAALGQIWYVPPTGGAPTAFLAAPSDSTRGGLFLPSGWGANSGNFLSVSLHVVVFDSGGNTISTMTDAGTGLPAEANFATPLIAPAEFVPYGGHLFVADINNQLWRADPAGGSLIGVFRYFQGTPFENFAPFGIEFTPVGWDPVFGNRLMMSNGFFPVDNGPGTRTASLVAVAADGTPSLFATILLKDMPDGSIGQTGLRQMLMAPDGFFLTSLGIPGQLLLVSVSGSDLGGGVLGELLALDHSGAVVAHLKVGGVLAKFDPRGMIITSDGHVLVSDTSDPILIASSRDFAPGREDRCGIGITSSVATSSLWPANHNLVNVGLAASATGNCPGATLSVSVFSDEDDEANTGEGVFSPDAKDIAVGSLRLRSERSGSGDGRVYLVVVKASDSLGDNAVSCNTVVVPRDQSKAARSSVEAQAAAAIGFCSANAGAPPPGYFVIGDGPVLGPKQ